MVVAEELGIDRYYSRLLSEDKIKILERIISENSEKTERGRGAFWKSQVEFTYLWKIVFTFIGDGINDSPVLARADAGIVMGELGSDAAVKSADITLMTDNPLKITEVIVTGRKTKRIVLQN